MNAFKTADFVRDEFADVMIYLTRSASILGVDLMKEAIAKIDRNEPAIPTCEVRTRTQVMSWVRA